MSHQRKNLALVANPLNNLVCNWRISTAFSCATKNIKAVTINAIGFTDKIYRFCCRHADTYYVFWILDVFVVLKTHQTYTHLFTKSPFSKPRQLVLVTEHWSQPVTVCFGLACHGGPTRSEVVALLVLMRAKGDLYESSLTDWQQRKWRIGSTVLKGSNVIEILIHRPTIDD